MRPLAALLLNNRWQSVFMKSLMILGGFIGFGIGVAFGLAQGSAWPGILWRASVAALLAGLVLRWWGRVWMNNLAEAQRDRPVTNGKPATAQVRP